MPWSRIRLCESIRQPAAARVGRRGAWKLNLASAAVPPGSRQVRSSRTGSLARSWAQEQGAGAGARNAGDKAARTAKRGSLLWRRRSFGERRSPPRPATLVERKAQHQHPWQTANPIRM